MSAALPLAVDALLPIYRRFPATFVAGKGVELEAEDGTRYLDFVSGISVNALGYGHPVIREAIARAASTGLLHTSNFFRTTPGEELAAALVEHSFADRVFFCNSGTEANEGAFKFARKLAGSREDASPEKREIVAFRGAFHGRTFAALTATDRPHYKEPYAPLVPGIRIVDPWNDVDLERAITAQRTAAVIVEPVQGEGGVRVFPPELLRDVRELCDEADAALIFDEIQCGMGRSGTLWAHEQAGVVPDMMTIAKAIGAGLPMGAILVNERVASALHPGDHGTTFGGGPFVTAVALAQFGILSDPEFLAAVRDKAAYLSGRLDELKARHPGVVEVRGLGLMQGIELADAVQPVIERAFERQLLLIAAGPNVIRLLPPLVIEHPDLARGIDILESCL